MITPYCTWHNRFRTWSKFSWEILDHLPYVLNLAVKWFSSVSHLAEVLDIFHLLSRHQMYHYHTTDKTGTHTHYMCPGRTNHTLWQMLLPWWRLDKSTVYQSQFYCAVSVSSLIYGYWKLTFWSAFTIHVPQRGTNNISQQQWSLMKQQFVIIHLYTVLQETKKKLATSLRDQHLSM